MSIIVRIRFKHNIYTRVIARNFRGWYMMYSKGNEYRFERNPLRGWELTKGELPDAFLYQILEQLEEYYQANK